MMKSALGLLCAACLFRAPAARADIPPSHVCATKDAVCHNAGAHYDEAGVCTAKTCTKGPPDNQYTYECLQCEPGTVPGAAGAGGDTSSAGAAGQATDNGEAGAQESSAGSSAAQGGASGAGGKHQAGNAGAEDGRHTDDGGCSISEIGTEKGVASLMLGLGLLALGVSRRRHR